MLVVKTVSYRFNVNGEYTKIMQARRGIWRGDPNSPLLFVLVMNYLTRTMQQLKNISNFNFHAKCEKLNIISFSFADDLLMFSIGDKRSVELMMEKFNKFSRSTGMKVNPSKFHIYFGAVDDHTIEEVKKLIGFREGSIPFRYLGIPLNSRKLVVKHYMTLITILWGE